MPLHNLGIPFCAILSAFPLQSHSLLFTKPHMDTLCLSYVGRCLGSPLSLPPWPSNILSVTLLHGLNEGVYRIRMGNGKQTCQSIPFQQHMSTHLYVVRIMSMRIQKHHGAVRRIECDGHFLGCYYTPASFLRLQGFNCNAGIFNAAPLWVNVANQPYTIPPVGAQICGH